MTRRLALALAVQLALVAWAVGPRLLPHVSGEEYRVAVQPVDPIEPFRGAYVDLDYGIRGQGGTGGRVWVPLRGDGDVRTLGPVSRGGRPGGPALRCEYGGGRVRCGIESFFASQREALRLERELMAGGAIARLRVDGAGRAVIVGLEPR